MTATSRPTSGGPPPAASTGDGKSISRRWAALAFTASSIATAALTVGGGWLSHHYEQQQDKRQEDYKAFREIADKLDGLCREFMTIYLATSSFDAEGKPRTARPLNDPALRRSVDAIQTNILQQDAILERIQLVVGGRDVITVQDYRRGIVDLSVALNDLPPVEDGKGLVQGLERSRKARLAVLETLQSRADSLIYRPPSARADGADESDG